MPRATKANEIVHPISEQDVGPRVWLVHSYHAGYPWVDAITRGVRMALSRSNVDLQILCMDTKRNTDEGFKRDAGDRARQIVTEWRPSVVIAVDDNAQKHFAQSYAGRDDVQIVFCGVNAKPEEYGYPASNVTGVLERPHFKSSLALLRRMVPQARRVAVLSDDSPTSAGALQFMDDATDFEIASKDMVSTFDQWKDRVRQLQATADAIAIYMYHTVKEAGSTQSLDPTAVMRWTVDNSSTPIVGFFIFAVDDGVLCGYLESGVEHGQRAGIMAVEILGGKRAGQIDIVTALDGQSMLNLKTARKLGLTIPDSIPGSIEILVEN